ncbi:AAA family ATPase [Candidatus Woesearchaeota archaeon]|nr:AAA family ATPase [Candidatus Woesearchaeota archaeon]|tara:strand:- start:6724 stop:7725 length:1002 start_codon:yes stop_codon:yes gene_type:complete
MEKQLHQKLLQENTFTDILGQDESKQQLKSALLMGRHVIIVGSPGIGKTTLAKNVAKLLPEITVNDCGYNCSEDLSICPSCKQGKKVEKKKISGSSRFIRIQGSPDLTSEDLLGDIDPIKALKFGASSVEAFTPGKIFKANNGVLFFDELNRCPAKLQNSLLQILEEKKATIGSYNIDFKANFIFIGTLNPYDKTTENLSDVFLDRCDLVYMTYPEKIETEKQIIVEKSKKVAEFPNELLTKMIEFVRSLRDNSNLEKFPSVRASIGLYERAQANALIRKSKKVELGDIKNALISVLAHRIELKPSAKYTETSKEFLEQEIEEKFGAASGEYR